MFLRPDEIKKRFPVSETDIEGYLKDHHIPFRVDKNQHLIRNAATRAARRKIQKARIKAEPGRNYSYRQAIVPWQIIYGNARVPGVLTFVDSRNNNLNLNLVYSIAGHEIDNVTKLFLDTDEVIFGASPDPRWSVSLKGADGVTTACANVFMAVQNMGSTSQTANADLMGQCPDKWTSAHKLSNIAHAYLLLKWSVLLFPNGLPDIHFEVRGKKVYDPRNGLTGFTSNAALVIADFLMDTKVGLGVPMGKIDMDILEDSANICDEDISIPGGTEKRYTIDGYFDSSEDKEQVLQTMAAAMAGTVTCVNGIYKIRAGAYGSSVIEITDDDWISPLRVQVKASMRDSFNGVRGTYVAADRNWEEREFPAVKNDFYMSQDNGERVWEDIQLPFTISPYRAQRLAKIALERNRQSISIEGIAKLKAYKAEPGETVQVTRPRLGWTQKEFEVHESELIISDDEGGSPIMAVRLVLSEQASAIYNWANGEENRVDLATNTNLPNPLVVNAPTGLTLESGTDQLYIRADGTVFSRIKVSWTHMSDAFVSSGGKIEIQYRKTGLTDWSFSTSVPGDNDFAFILDVQDGASYDVQIRAINAAQIASAYTQMLGYAVIGKSAPPSNVAQISAAVGPFGIDVSWQAIPDKDIAHYILKVGAPGDVWGAAITVAEVRGTAYRVDLKKSGSHQFQIKAVDSSSNESTDPALVNVNIAGPSQVQITKTIAGENVVLKWTESTAEFSIAEYHISDGLVFSASSLIATVRSTAYTLKAKWAGVKRFWVVAQDVAGNLGIENYCDITVQIPTAVQTLQALPIDNNVKLTWQEPSFHTLPIDYYQVRKGDDFATAAILGIEKGTISVLPELTAGTYSYWVVAVDSAGNIGQEKSVRAIVSAPPDFVLRDDQLIDPNSGTGTNIIVQDDIIAATNRVFHPTEINDLLGNPNMGIQTTQKFMNVYNTPANNPLNIPSQSAVYRVFWSYVETAADVFDWTEIDTMMNNAKASNQKTNFRVICYDEANTPFGVKASRTVGSGNSQLVITSASYGGNSKQVEIIVAGISTALSVVVTSSKVTINSATNGAGAATSTVNQVITALNANGTFTANFTAGTGSGTGAGVVSAFTLANLTGGVNVSNYLQTYAGAAGYQYKDIDDGSTQDQYAPNFDNATVQTRLANFLQNLADHYIHGVRFADHPNLGNIDIGIWGLFGEWHHSGAYLAPAYTTPMPVPAYASLQFINAEFFSKFPKQFKFAILDRNNVAGIQDAISRGAGWRADGLGLPYFDNSMYPYLDTAVPLTNVWKTAPVNYEPYNWVTGAAPSWVASHWDIPAILNFARNHHIGEFNAKGRFSFVGAATLMSDFARDIGYRIVCKTVEHQQSIPAGTSSSIKLQWQNVGVGKDLYGHYTAIKLSKAGQGDFISKGILADFEPGTIVEEKRTVSIPSYLPDGNYTVSVGVVDPNSLKPIVALAISGRDSTGWYPVTTVNITNASPVFSPLKYPNVFAWHTNNAGIIKTQSSQVVAIADDFIEEWRDQSGHNRHFEQLTTGKKPQWKASTVNSLPGLLFDGSDDHMLANLNLRFSTANTQKLMVIAVLRWLSNTANSTFLTGNFQDTSGTRFRIRDSGTPNATYSLTARRLNTDTAIVASSTATHAAPVTELRTALFDWSAKTMKFWVNGYKGAPKINAATLPTAGNTADDWLKKMHLCTDQNATAEFSNLYLCELLFLTQEAGQAWLTDADINGIEAGFAAKYGITLAT